MAAHKRPQGRDWLRKDAIAVKHNSTWRSAHMRVISDQVARALRAQRRSACAFYRMLRDNGVGEGTINVLKREVRTGRLRFNYAPKD